MLLHRNTISLNFTVRVTQENSTHCSIVGNCKSVELLYSHPVTKETIFFSLFLRGGVPSPNFLKLFTIL